MSEQSFFWRRLDVQGLERLQLSTGPQGVEVRSTVLCVEDGGFRLDHRWRLDGGWRAQSVVVERWGAAGYRVLKLERDGAQRWRVDGLPRPDLDGADEPDLSVTPFCNTLAIRRTPTEVGDSHRLDVAYIDAAAMTIVRSSQRYDRQGPAHVRYVDLGVAKGFEADLTVDDQGLVLRYEHLFERITPPA